MRATVEGAGVELAYDEWGHGPSVLLVHDMGRDARSWTALAETLAARARVVVYDRRGYGDSGAPEPYEATTVYEQSEDAVALIGRLGLAPALVCGAGFGALVVLDLAERHPGLVRALLCAEPPLYAFVPAATAVLASERELLREALCEHGPQGAVDRWRSTHVPAYDVNPAPNADPAAAAGPAVRAPGEHRGLFADFAGLSSWPVTRAQLRALEMPTVILTGPATPPHLHAAADALAAHVPGARRASDGDLAAAALALLA